MMMTGPRLIDFLAAVRRWRGAPDARTGRPESGAYSPLDHPALARMSERELADLPFARCCPEG